VLPLIGGGDRYYRRNGLMHLGRKTERKAAGVSLNRDRPAASARNG